MACFVVPGTEAIVTTIATKVVKTKEKEVESSTHIPFSQKMGWLNKMLWGGSALLAFEHMWHGELVPFFPFLSKAVNAKDAAEMLQEMSTVGVAMAVGVTAVWAGMLAVVHVFEKKADKEAKEEV